MWVLKTCMGVHKGVMVRGILGTEPCVKAI